MTTGLSLGTGGTKGAYSAGVAATLGRELGKDYFDRGYGCSVGTYPLTFLFSGQPDVIENTWRNLIGGTCLVDITLLNLLQRRALKLEYLEGLFTEGDSRLDLDALFSRDPKLTFVMTDIKTGRPIYFTPNRENVLAGMTMSSSLPLARRAVALNGSYCLDGGLSDPLPISKALDDGCEELVAVSNYPPGFIKSRRGRRFLEKATALLYLSYPHLARKIWDHSNNLRDHMEAIGENPRVRIIRPSRPLPLTSSYDTNVDRVNATFDQGVEDAKQFLYESR